MITRLSLIIALLAIVFVVSQIPASPLTVRLDHWSYHFIERLQARGYLSDFLSNIKPYSRDELADMVLQILDLMEDGKINLSEVEKQQVDLLKRKLAPEMAERGVTDVTGYKHLLDWSNEDKSLVLEPGYSQYVTLKRGTEDYNIYVSGAKLIIRGDLGDGFFFYTNGRASYENSDEALPLWHPYLDVTRYPWSSVAESYLVFRLPWFDLQIGKDQVLWGPGYHGVIGLSGVDPTFDIVKLPIRIWKFKFVSILGFLRDDLAREYRSDIVRKYLSAHRVELIPFDGVSIAFQEVYIYAENLHIELLNPLMPYQMAEDYLNDVGNNTMEGDIDITLLPYTRIYASVFLDDLHPDKSFFTYAGNRWAILSGALIADPFGLKNFDFRAEYARVEPWVYPHKGIIQDPPVPLSYKHFNTPLGHWIGPNSDDLLFEVNHQFTRDLKAKLSYNRIRKGEIGGSLYNYDSHAIGYEDKHFLMGIVEKTRSVSFGLTYRLFQDSMIEINYIYTRVNNKQKEEAKLPEDHPDKQSWEAGFDWSQNIIEAGVKVSY